MKHKHHRNKMKGDVIRLSQVNEAELERRREEYKSGKGKSYTIDECRIELRQRIWKKSSNID